MQKRQSKMGSASQRTTITRGAFAAITAVEGLKLSPEGQMRVFKATTTDKRRAEVLKAYTGAKKQK